MSTNEPHPIAHQKLVDGKSRGSFMKEVVIFLILIVGVVLPIRLFIAQPFVVSGASMQPTFENGQYIIVDRVSYSLGEPERGDVVIFKYPDNDKKFFIKRIVGLPGETVTLDGEDVTIITTSGETVPVNEDYVIHEKISFLTTELEDDEYFVMGDNRRDSYDSRSWGPLQEDFIVGRAFIRLLPITKIDYLPGQ